jgi:hypothetical protein
VNRWLKEKPLWHACADLRTGVQKKEKDRVLHENVLNVQDPCFLGGSSLGLVGIQFPCL